MMVFIISVLIGSSSTLAQLVRDALISLLVEYCHSRKYIPTADATLWAHRSVRRCSGCKQRCAEAARYAIVSLDDLRLSDGASG
jgi:hypothetical protein